MTTCQLEGGVLYEFGLLYVCVCKWVQRVRKGLTLCD